MSNAAITIKEASFNYYEQQILHSVSLVVNKGDFVVLVGPNGSGKSTLAKMINGLVHPRQGQVFIGTKNIARLPVFQIASMVSTLTQDLHYSTFGDLSVLSNLELAMTRSAVKDKKNRSQLVDYVTSFNKSLAEKLDAPASHLSGGQRQALALAMCFVHRPSVLVLDEHTSALDPKAANNLMFLTNEHVVREKLTTIMITHSLDYALHYGSRLIALNEGKIVLDVSGPQKGALSKKELIALAYS